MLDHLRAAVNSWPAKVLLGLVLLSFIAWGGHSAFQSGSDNTLLKSGDMTVDAPGYNLALRNTVMRLSASAGHYLTPDEINRYGIRQAVFGEAYRNLVLNNAAEEMKLGVSDKSAADVLSRDPLFKGPDGNFDINIFNYFIQNLQTTRDKFLNSFYVEAARRGQITSAVMDGVSAPDVFYKAMALYTKQTRNVDYAAVLPTPLNQITDPDDSALAAWFKDNSGNFKTPEYRQVTYISLLPADVSDASKIDDKQIAAYYNAHKNEYIETPEKRSFSLIRFADKKTAEAALADIQASVKSGQNTADAYKAYLAKHPNLKNEGKQNIALSDLPALLGTEIFSLRRGEISNVINELQDYSIAFLENITPARAKPINEVSGQIKQAIAREQAADILPNYRKKIEDARYDGADLTEIAKQYHLTLNHVTVDKNGNNEQGQNINFSQGKDLLANIFSAAENTDTDPFALKDGGYIWYNVDKIIAPRNSALSEVRAKAVMEWKQEQQQERLDSLSTALAKELNKGADFGILAQQNNLIAHNIDRLGRTMTDDKLGQDALSAIFAAAKGESGLTLGADGNGRIIFRVNAINEPKNISANSLSQDERNAISDRLATDLLALYITAQAKKTPVQVNPTVYNQVMEQN